MNARLVAATSQGGLEDQVSAVFGRAPTYTVVEVDDGRVVSASVHPNPHKDAPSGAGIQAAQMVASKTPQAVLAGSFGPNVAGVLAQAGVQMISVSGMTVGEAVEACLAGRLSANMDVPSGATFGSGRGQGMGRGAGRGMGRGAGGGRAPASVGGLWGGLGSTSAAGRPEHPEALRQRISHMESELEQVKRKLAQFEGGA